MSRADSRTRPQSSAAVGAPSSIVAVDHEDPGGYQTLVFGSVMAPASPSPPPRFSSAGPTGPTPELTPPISPETTMVVTEGPPAPPVLYGQWGPSLASPASSVSSLYPPAPLGHSVAYAPVPGGEPPIHDPSLSSAFVRPPFYPAQMENAPSPSDFVPPNPAFVPPPPDQAVQQVHPRPFFPPGMQEWPVQYMVLAFPPQPYPVEPPWITHPPSSQPREAPQDVVAFQPPAVVPPRPRPAHLQQQVQPSSYPSTPVSYGHGPQAQLYPQPVEAPYGFEHAYHTAPPSPTNLTHMGEGGPAYFGDQLAIGGWFAPAPPPEHPRRASEGGAVGQAWMSAPPNRGRGRGRGRGGGGRGRFPSAGQTNGRELTSGQATIQWTTPAGVPSPGLGFIQGAPSTAPGGFPFGLPPNLQLQPSTKSPAPWNGNGRRRGSSGPRPGRGGAGGGANPVSTPWSAQPPGGIYIPAGPPTAWTPPAGSSSSTGGPYSSSVPTPSPMVYGQPPVLPTPSSAGFGRAASGSHHPLPRKPSSSSLYQA